MSEIVRQIAEEVATAAGWTGEVPLQAFIAGYVACDAALGETDRANKRLLDSRDQRISQLEEAADIVLEANAARPFGAWLSAVAILRHARGLIEADPDVAETAWAIIDHHRATRTGG